MPVVSGITINNGVNYYTDDTPDNDDIFTNSLTISTRGEYSGTVTYHKGNFLLANNILVMRMSGYTDNQKLFIGAIINNLNYGGYNGYPTKETLKKDYIYLPTKNNKIDFEFMELFVAELEAQRVAELEAYLKTTGLNDYKLTEEEKKVINSFDDIVWKEFSLLNLFGKATRGKRLKSLDRIEGSLPFVTAGEANEGISEYIGNNVTIFPKNTITIDMFGSAKYRSYDYGADDHISVIHSENASKEENLFITAAIHKSSHNGQFNYGKNFYPKDADNLYIRLPITDNNMIDFEYMRIFISAIQKLVIKNVVKYKDKLIDKTKSVISNN